MKDTSVKARPFDEAGFPITVVRDAGSKGCKSLICQAAARKKVRKKQKIFWDTFLSLADDMYDRLYFSHSSFFCSAPVSFAASVVSVVSAFRAAIPRKITMAQPIAKRKIEMNWEVDSLPTLPRIRSPR